ncbi:MAG TPA: sulfite oxidase-like oxidoreductase [Nitrososphaerales archaeon]|nr:sulfite oxidase-like oxidoreductase [Nitrososphaerales archaeon]
MTAQEPLPPGQVWGKKFVIYAALSIPRVDARNWKLRIDGMVKQPVEYTYDQLTSGDQFHYVRSFHCVTQWSIKDVEWDGVQIRKLVEPAGVDPASKWVMFRCVDGYTAPVPVEDALSEDSIVALRLNGKPLSAEQGFPVRPFMPQLYGWKSAKWLNRMEFIRDYADGYWEMYGYHERANVWEEERFKGHSGKHSKRTAYGTA